MISITQHGTRLTGLRVSPGWVRVSSSLLELFAITPKTVNFISGKGLNHHQFQSFLEEITSECGDVPYHMGAMSCPIKVNPV